MATIYKICPAALWRAAEEQGVFAGSGDDIRDRFIHFSTAGQVSDTARRHFAGVGGLMLVAVEASRLGPALRYERSRHGALFPHLYGDLDPAAVLWAKPMPLGGDGRHLLPDLAP